MNECVEVLETKGCSTLYLATMTACTGHETSDMARHDNLERATASRLDELALPPLAVTNRSLAALGFMRLVQSLLVCPCKTRSWLVHSNLRFLLRLSS